MEAQLQCDREGRLLEEIAVAKEGVLRQLEADQVGSKRNSNCGAKVARCKQTDAVRQQIADLMKNREQEDESFRRSLLEKIAAAKKLVLDETEVCFPLIAHQCGVRDGKNKTIISYKPLIPTPPLFNPPCALLILSESHVLCVD
eukprot:Polyplicarium_translucidae@DN3896_c0_g1_i1.p2